jgi:hypothetical protein
VPHPEFVRIRRGRNDTSALKQPEPSSPNETKRVDCSAPYRVEFDQPFTIDVSLVTPPSDTTKPSEHVQITMISGGVTYKPSTFPLRIGEHKYVQATAKRRASGLVVINGYSNHGFDACDGVVDAAYDGHLKIPTIQLPYKEPRSLTVQIVDNDGKPLKVGVSLEMQVQSEDATVGPADASYNGGKRAPLTIPIQAESTSSEPFLLTATNPKGGPVRVLATLRIKNGSVIAQNELLLDSEPADWLPILLAIGGALLYAGYDFVSSPVSGTNSRSAVVWKIIASILAGLIAYLFANFDLLGLKLDPRVLRTYAILGFVFSFVGIDLILSKRFQKGAQPKPPTTPVE